MLWHVLVLILDWTAVGAPTAARFRRAAVHPLGPTPRRIPRPPPGAGLLDNAEHPRDLDDDVAEWCSFLLAGTTCTASSPSPPS
jgi:hypothetical protein